MNNEALEIKHVQYKVGKLLQVLVKDLEDCCGSDSMSLNALQEKIRFIPSNAVQKLSFLHQACSDKNVTMEIIAYLLNVYPAAANICTNMLSPNESDTRRAYPLHLACCNDCCPRSVIDLLLKKNPSALRHLCLLGKGIRNNARGHHHGLPLHYYLSRKSNIDLESVKMLVSGAIPMH